MNDKVETETKSNAREERALYEDAMREMFGDDEYLVDKYMSEYDNEQN